MSQIQLLDISNSKLSTLSVHKDEYIVFRNLDPVDHQINSDTSNLDFSFDVGILHPGDVSSPVCFNVLSPKAGFKYGCGLHMGMEAIIYVGTPIAQETPDDPSMPDMPSMSMPGGHDHLKHYHGFVTGGSKGDRIYMTHTPIFSDERHHFQIILQGRFKEQKHINAYNKIRASSYGHRKFETFFDVLALIDIRDGKVKEIITDPERGARIYPGGVSTVVPELINALIVIEKILHFRTFTPDMDYPEFLSYLMYGNETDVFIDHFISRAPNFHSVAKLAKVPVFWKPEYYETTLQFEITSKKMIDVSPKILRRVAFVDNRFHLIWGTPSGSGTPADPLAPIEDEKDRSFPVRLPDGSNNNITINFLLHFDATNLLNEGLGY